MQRQIVRFGLVLTVCALMTGCETVSEVIGIRKKDTSAEVSPVWWDGPRVRPGVALVIQVGTPATAPTTIETLVDQNGDITLPLLLQEPVHCDGLQLEELKQNLVKAYSKFYRQPQVTVTFAPYDGRGVSPWGTVTVLGEVGSPGPVNIPSTMELTVTKVLQMAGGVKGYADRSKIKVSRREKDGRISKSTINLKEIGEGGRVDKDMVLRAGDVVWVPETWY